MHCGCSLDHCPLDWQTLKVSPDKIYPGLHLNVTLLPSVILVYSRRPLGNRVGSPQVPMKCSIHVNRKIWSSLVGSHTPWHLLPIPHDTGHKWGWSHSRSGRRQKEGAVTYEDLQTSHLCPRGNSDRGSIWSTNKNCLHAVDKALHDQNVMQSVIIDWFCYIRTNQEQFTEAEPSLSKVGSNVFTASWRDLMQPQLL